MASLPYYYGWILGVLPGLAMFVFIKFFGGRPWHLGNLIAGSALLGIAIYMFILLTDWEALAELLQSAGKMTAAERQTAKTSSVLWLVVIPMVFGGVGVNVVSAWLQSKRP